MNIICAPDSFKETLSATVAARSMARGIARAASERHVEVAADVCPVGDGGEGTMDAMVGAMGGEYRQSAALDPLGRPLRARYAIVNTQARDPEVNSDGPARHSQILKKVRMSRGAKCIGIVELAEASGLARMPLSKRDPMKTSSFGTGQLIRSASDDDGCNEIIVCIGGSATVDGGAGIAQALGARFFDDRGNLIPEPITGGMLSRIARAERPSDVPAIRAACDVTNPLCGPDGAALVYGPQKGATPWQARELDSALAHFASIVGGDPTLPGAGAAGGAGFGLASLCRAELVRGIDLVLDWIDFRHRCEDAALVITGEGRLDRQSLRGKACMGVARTAAELGVPTIAIVGSIGDGAEECLQSCGGFLRQFVCLSERFGPDRARRECAALIEAVTFELVRDLSQPAQL